MELRGQNICLLCGMRASSLTASAVLLGVLGAAPAPVVPTDDDRPARPHVVALADTTSAVDDAIEIGRYWHERERLLAVRTGSGLPPTDQLRLAEAEAGWGNWTAVVGILEDAEWRDRLGNGRGAFLLARALEQADDTDAAIDAYARFLSVAPLGSADIVTAQIRRARLLASRGDLDLAMDEIAALDSAPAGLASWVALELAEGEARAGNVETVARLYKLIVDPAAEARKWELIPRSHLNGDDRVAALAAYEEALSHMDEPGDRARVWSTIGELRRERGNEAGAREAFMNALATEVGGEAAVRASTGLIGMGIDDPGLALRMAQALAGARRSEEALRAYELYAELAGADVRPQAQLARARLMSGRRQNTAAASILTELVALEDPEIATGAIETLIQVRRRQGRTSAIADLEAELLRRFPSSAQTASVLFFRADTHHDDGEMLEASELYRQAAAAAPRSSRGGLSSMRLGQIHITRGEFQNAAEVFEAYLDLAPNGAYAEEATYWAARSWLEIDRPDRAGRLLDQLENTSPVSYYAVQTADLTGREFRIPVVDASPLPVPPWLTTGIELLKITQAAGLTRAERALAGRLVDRARVNDVTLLQVAQGFHGLRRSLEAIQLGWEVQRRGHPWDRLLLEVIYPFPFEDLILEEAREVGVDPFLMAALIRQESAFVPTARSVANARGLMQVMPATGRELARSVGPRSFSTPKLYVPDVNLHLGATYLRDMMGRYDGRLPLVLSAYNAGPHRASRWQRFPEVADPVRFTERIPFRETRGYVKNVTRNYRVYEFLYGE